MKQVKMHNLYNNGMKIKLIYLQFKEVRKDKDKNKNKNKNKREVQIQIKIKIKDYLLLLISK